MEIIQAQKQYQEDEKALCLPIAQKLLHEITILNISQANLLLQFFLDNHRKNEYVKNIHECLSEFKLGMGRNCYNLAQWNAQQLVDLFKSNGKKK